MGGKSSVYTYLAIRIFFPHTAPVQITGWGFVKTADIFQHIQTVWRFTLLKLQTRPKWNKAIIIIIIIIIINSFKAKNILINALRSVHTGTYSSHDTLRDNWSDN
jgi:hypothetical protein